MPKYEKNPKAAECSFENRKVLIAYSDDVANAMSLLWSQADNRLPLLLHRDVLLEHFVRLRVGPDSCWEDAVKVWKELDKQFTVSLLKQGQRRALDWHNLIAVPVRDYFFKEVSKGRKGVHLENMSQNQIRLSLPSFGGKGTTVGFVIFPPNYKCEFLRVYLKHDHEIAKGRNERSDLRIISAGWHKPTLLEVLK